MGTILKITQKLLLYKIPNKCTGYNCRRAFNFTSDYASNRNPRFHTFNNILFMNKLNFVNSSSLVNPVNATKLMASVRHYSATVDTIPLNGVIDSELSESIITNLEKVDINDDDDLQDQDNVLEEEILDFLNWRNISFDDSDANMVMISCPNCKHSDEIIQELSVHKNSGTYFCPRCCSEGEWEELCRLLDANADSLTEEQLRGLLEHTALVAEEHAGILEQSPYRALTVATLRRHGCRVSDDAARLLVPVTRGGRAVGCYSLPLRDQSKTEVARFLTSHAAAWTSVPPEGASSTPEGASVTAEGTSAASEGTSELPSPATRIVVTSDVAEALFLTQCGMHAVTVPAGVNWDAAIRRYSNATTTPLASVWGLGSEVRQVQLWLTRPNVLPYRFFAHVWRQDLTCGSVDSTSQVPLYERNPRKLRRALRGGLTPILSDQVVELGSLQEEIYHRLTHRHQVHGVSFTRFPRLQSLLLGHRPGEVTVVSGPTGAGKTTLMAEYSLDLALRGVPTLWVSLEVAVVRLAEVLLQQYSGEPLPQRRADYLALAHDFTQLPVSFLNTHGQQPIDDIIQTVRKSCVTRGVRHVIVDNLQFLVGCQDSATERWSMQDRAMSAFRSFATQHRCHVTLIVHPKKIGAQEALTLQAIGGGARVTQEADNVLLLQVLHDGPRLRKELQVVKNRFGGHLGSVPLRFHEDSLTFSGWFSQKRTTRKPRPKNSVPSNKRTS